MNKLISIIVPVYNRAEEIAEFLSSFCNQDIKTGFEIIIVDDGSTDELNEVLAQYTGKLQIRYFHQQNQGPGAARNRGMAEAAGELMVFIDSDCTVPADYISKLQVALSEDSFDAFGGPDTQREDFPPFLKAVNYSMTSFIGTGGTRGSAKRSVAKYYPRSFNMGIRRRVYEKIGGMNALRHGQDMEFSNRIYKAGFRVIFLPELQVFHKRRTNLRRFFKQIFNWGVTRINLGTIDRAMLKPVHALPAVILIIFLGTVVGAVFFNILRSLLLLEAVLGVFVALFSFTQSAIRNHSLLVGCLSVLTLFTQVLAYGSGFITGLVKKLFLPKGEWVSGFRRKYYK
ncbi:MAG: glycosyltransferase [Candidatus Cloacimonetes bacterium]|nr:glycosyltransferase [Candidatus Cloacimonadota bacterium]